MRFPSLGWEDPLEKEMATHSSVLAWKIPWTEEPGRLSVMTEHKHKSMEQRKEFRNIYSQLLFDKGAKIIPREKFIFSTNGTSIIEDHAQKCCI